MFYFVTDLEVSIAYRQKSLLKIYIFPVEKNR